MHMKKLSHRVGGFAAHVSPHCDYNSLDLSLHKDLKYNLYSQHFHRLYLPAATREFRESPFPIAPTNPFCGMSGKRGKA